MDTHFTEGNGENEGGDMSTPWTCFWDMSKKAGKMDTSQGYVEGIDMLR